MQSYLLYKQLWTDYLEQTLSRDVQKHKRSMENYLSTLPWSQPLTANNTTVKSVLLQKERHCKSPNSRSCLMFIFKTALEYKPIHCGHAKCYNIFKIHCPKFHNFYFLWMFFGSKNLITYLNVTFYLKLAHLPSPVWCTEKQKKIISPHIGWYPREKEIGGWAACAQFFFSQTYQSHEFILFSWGMEKKKKRI